MRIGKATDTGRIRASNEDAVLALELPAPGGGPDQAAALLAVADGMGGAQQGEVASSLALSALSRHITGRLGAAGRPADDGPPGGGGHLRRILLDAVQEANQQVFARRTASRNDMGTTLVALLAAGSGAWVANVGDSRAYLLRGGRLQRLTTDHSLVAAMVSEGLITPDEVYSHPQRNIITRSLGGGPAVEADSFRLELERGDRVMLCSDGLWEMARDAELGGVLRSAPEPQGAAEELVRLANRNGGADNISVVVLDF